MGSKLAAPLLFLIAAAVAQADDDTLHAGHRASVGVRSQKDAIYEAQADLRLLPSPVGSRYWGAAIPSTRLELSITQDLDTRALSFQGGRAQYLRWPNLHLLGIERNLDLGQALGVELVGLYLPVPLHGNATGRSWSILQSGGALGYRHQDTRAGAQRDGDFAEVALSCRIDIQSPLGDRAELRAFAEVAYRLAAGASDGKPAAEHLLNGKFGSGFYLDLTPGAPVRYARRTDPATGQVTQLPILNPGSRFRWMLLEIGAEARPLDSITTTPIVTGTAKSGVSYEF